MTGSGLRIVTTILCLVICSGLASAETTGSVFIGGSFPAGDFKSGFDAGYNVGGYLTTPLSPVFDLGGIVTYHEFKNLLGDLPVLGDYFGEDFDAWEIQALGQANAAWLRGFLGLGVTNHSELLIEGGGGRKTHFSWQLGIAAWVHHFEARAGYHRIQLDGEATGWFDVTVGVVF